MKRNRNHARPHRRLGVIGRKKRRRDVRKREAFTWTADPHEAIKWILWLYRHPGLYDAVRDWLAPFLG